MLRRLRLSCILFALAPTLALAINVPALPAGMCALEQRVPEHAAALNFLRQATAGGNTLVSAFANCDELAALANKKAQSITHYGAVMTQSLGSPLSMDRKAYVKAVAAAFRANGGALAEAALTDARQAVNATAQESGISEPKAMTADPKGVLFSDDTMVVIAVKQGNMLGSTTTSVNSVAAITLLAGAPVSVNLYAPASDANAFARSTAMLKQFVPALIVSNP